MATTGPRAPRVSLGSCARIGATADGAQILAEVRTPGDAAEADVNNGSEHFGRVEYVHGGVIDKPLAVVRMEYNGTTVAIPHANYRGMFDSGTCVGADGVACDQIEWPAATASAYMELARSDSGEANWFGSLIAEKSDASGLLYMRNRYMDPKTGKFTQPDPIGLAGGLNVYGYANGDPVNYSDPFGLWPDPQRMARTAGLFAALAGSWIDGAKIEVAKAYEQLVYAAADIEIEMLKGSKQIAKEVIEEGALLASGPKAKVAPALVRAVSVPGGLAGRAGIGGAGARLLGAGLSAGTGGLLMVLTTPTTTSMSVEACRIEKCSTDTKIEPNKSSAVPR